MAVYRRRDDSRRLSGLMQQKIVMCGRRRQLQLLASALLGARWVVETPSQLAVLQLHTVPRSVQELLRRKLYVRLLLWSRQSPSVLLIIRSGVARICCQEGQRLKLCHGALTVDFGAGCSSCSMTNNIMINAVLIERAVMSCWHLHQLMSQTTQYLDSWLSDLEVEGARAPVPHSWRRHWSLGSCSWSQYNSHSI